MLSRKDCEDTCALSDRRVTSLSIAECDKSLVRGKNHTFSHGFILAEEVSIHRMSDDLSDTVVH